VRNFFGQRRPRRSRTVYRRTSYGSMEQAIGALIVVVLVLLLLRLVGVLYGSAFLWHGRTRSSTVLAGASLSGLRPSFVSCVFLRAD